MTQPDPCAEYVALKLACAQGRMRRAIDSLEAAKVVFHLANREYQRAEEELITARAEAGLGRQIDGTECGQEGCAEPRYPGSRYCRRHTEEILNPPARIDGPGGFCAMCDERAAEYIEDHGYYCAAHAAVIHASSQDGSTG